MYNFCTLFDTNYLSRGIALYRSLKNVCDDFHIYIFAFDNTCFNILTKMNLEKATIISLKDFEDKELLNVKSSRTKAEYCWTSTSSTILYVLQKYKVDSCTYLDADLYFYSSPEPIFNELTDNSILITEHRYSPKYDKSKKSGKYCVQFITFKNDEYGLKSLEWWRERCIEWCYNRFEDGKFGDQLYLDDWTTRFDGVHVMQNQGGGLAAWNVQQYKFFNKNKSLYCKEIKSGKDFKVIFYHFHYLRLYKNNIIELGRRFLSNQVRDYFYKPYILLLDEIKNEILKLDKNIIPDENLNYNLNLKSLLISLWRKFRGTYNVYNKTEFIKN
ncbi:MAG: glycosyl transferase [Ignavibacteriales bacterium CG12_big_fil_rev_8_21_14_0_65_30_8]|nr:MAG: glycosyl transferase [Ignavibacteriales bacterium CG12_big_fil_rev_8_21_14_0_65_30_8]